MLYDIIIAQPFSGDLLSRVKSYSLLELIVLGVLDDLLILV